MAAHPRLAPRPVGLAIATLVPEVSLLLARLSAGYGM